LLCRNSIFAIAKASVRLSESMSHYGDVSSIFQSYIFRSSIFSAPNIISNN